MLTFPSRLYDIVRYEHERGNTLLYSREETKEQYPSFRFLTKSQVVPLIEYQFSATNSPGFSIATLIYTDKDLVKGTRTLTSRSCLWLCQAELFARLGLHAV